MVPARKPLISKTAGELGAVCSWAVLLEYLVLEVPYSTNVAIGCEDKTLMAIDVSVGRPRTWVITGAVTPIAFPMEVPATAVVAAIKRSDLRVIGAFAHDFNRYVESFVM